MWTRAAHWDWDSFNSLPLKPANMKIGNLAILCFLAILAVMVLTILPCIALTSITI